MVSAPKDASTCLPHCGERCSKECDDQGDVGMRGSVMSCRVRFDPRGKMGKCAEGGCGEGSCEGTEGGKDLTEMQKVSRIR